MNVRDLPFEKAKVRVLRFDPWSKQSQDADFIFEKGDEVYTIKSPYDWQDKVISKGDVLSVEVERFEVERYGKVAVRGRLKLLD